MQNQHLAVLLLAFTLCACSGGDESSDTGCTAVPPLVVVAVTDPDGVAIEGASVQWDRVDCPESPGGKYACTPTVGGTDQLSVIAMNMRAYSSFETIPDPACNPAPFDIAVELQPGIS